MTKHFLITRPNHDKETSYLYSFSKGAMVIAKDNSNIRLTELDGAKAKRKNLEKSLINHDKTLIFLNGHGDEKTVFGHNDEPILVKDNVKLLKGKIVYALACNSLVELGKFAVKKGAKAYIGYRNQFMWVGDPAKSAIPDKDRNAAPFRKVCHTLISSLLKGNTVKESVNKTKEEYKRLIRTYGTSEDDFGDAPVIGLALAWDMSDLGWEGNPNTAF